MNFGMDGCSIIFVNDLVPFSLLRVLMAISLLYIFAVVIFVGSTLLKWWEVSYYLPVPGQVDG